MVKNIFRVLVAIFFLQGCSYVHYKSATVNVVTIEFFTKGSLKNMEYKSDKATLMVNGYKRNSSKAAGKLTEGVVRGVLK